jgi:hypothetical protein
MISGRVNHLAIVTLVILHQVLGFFWYSPLVFGGRWLAYIGKTPEELNPANPVPYIVSLLSSIVLCYTVAILFRMLQVETVLKGIVVAVGLWFSFLFLNTATYASFAGEPSGLVFITTGNVLAQFILTGAVLAGWKSKKKKR